MLLSMRLTAKVKLLPSPEQKDVLLQTLEAANFACNYVSDIAWDKRTFRQFDLHKLAYRDIREKFNLTAQMAVRVIGKVADAYKVDRKTKRTFKAHGSIAFDDRILTWKVDQVSIWTLPGRIIVPFVCAPRDREFLHARRGESDLALINGDWFLFASYEVEEPKPADVEDFLGIDLGIVNIVVDSDGDSFSGAKIDKVRRIFSHRRRNLQKKGTKSAKRKLKKLSGKQSRFQKDTNHCISKTLVSKAKGTGCGIALEKLTHIRTRVTVRKLQRARHSNWAFFDLQSKIEYKARLAGIPVIYVNPAFTSQVCPICGCVDRKNRPTQSQFLCIACGFAGLADAVAARNIGFRARVSVSKPMVSAPASVLGTSLAL